MSARAGMLCRVMIRGAVTTQRHAARLTCAQVNPLIPDLHTLFTFLTLRMLNRFDSLDMSATFFFVHNGAILPQNSFSHKEAQKAQMIPLNFFRLALSAGPSCHSLRPIHHIATTKPAVTVFAI
jgi:hypothetical protein